jgi:hypothetical protein
VVCRKCHTQVYIDRARRVPEGVGPDYPSAGSTDRVAPGARGAATHTYELPTAAEINLVGPPLPTDDALLVRAARFGTATAAALVLFLLANNLILLIAGAPLAAGYAAGTDSVVVYLYLITPVPVAVAGLSGIAAAMWHLALVAVITASCVLFLRQHGRGALQNFSRVLLGPGSPRLDEPNGIFLMARLFCVSVFVTEIVYIMAGLFGGDPIIPEGITSADPGQLLITLAHASVWEEVVSRSLLLGLPLLAVHWSGRGSLERPAWSYLTGGKFALDGPAVAFLLFSASAFGLAHVASWDLWKLPGSFVAGLVFGVLFLRLGLHAAIVGHFLHDYLPVAGVLGSTEGYALLLAIMLLAMELVGAANFVRYMFVLREVIRFGGVPPYLGGPTPVPAGDAGPTNDRGRAAPAPEPEPPPEPPPPPGG